MRQKEETTWSKQNVEKNREADLPRLSIIDEETEQETERAENTTAELDLDDYFDLEGDNDEEANPVHM